MPPGMPADAGAPAGRLSSHPGSGTLPGLPHRRSARRLEVFNRLRSQVEGGFQGTDGNKSVQASVLDTRACKRRDDPTRVAGNPPLRYTI